MRRFSTRRPAAVLAVGLLVIGTAGCGGDHAAIDGTVTYDGTAVDNGTITFVPEAGGPRVTAPIRGGKYALDAESGPAPGKYKVEVTWNKRIPGKKAADPDVQGGDVKQVLPDKYNRATTLRAEVRSGPNTTDFKLDK